MVTLHQKQYGCSPLSRTFTVAFLPMYACYCTPRKMQLDLTFHRGLLLFTLQDKSCWSAVCSSCVAQWEVRPEAGCRWGACSHTRLPPLGCLSAFQHLFPDVKNASEQLRPGEGKIWMTGYSKQPRYWHKHAFLCTEATGRHTGWAGSGRAPRAKWLINLTSQHE